MYRVAIITSFALLLLLGTGPAAGAMTVHFPLSSAEVPSAERGEIDRLAASLAANPLQRVILAGHADSSGPEDFNRRLSHDRAAAVRRLLVGEHRIAPVRVGITWLGSSQPVASDATAAGRARNRRVSVAFIGAGDVETGSQPVLHRPSPQPSPVAPTETIEAVIDRANVVSNTAGETLALNFAAGATKLSQDHADRLAAFVEDFKQDPAARLLVTGVTPPGGDLQATRRRIDAVKNLLTYIHGISSRRIMTNWSTDTGINGDILLQQFATTP